LRILFTGGSSFTGSWFVRGLARAGHDVVATFRSPLGTYSGTRAHRVSEVVGVADALEGVAFGEPAFLETVRRRHFDVVCHHGAEVGDYRNPGFDVEAALRANTHNHEAFLEALAAEGTALVMTGTVFESNEGSGDDELQAFSPYGLSKTLTAEVFKYRCHAAGVRLGKFVMANAFGPWEELRFTSYLARSWLGGETPRVQTPAYVRDNAHVSLLALAYVRFVEEIAAADGGYRRLGPSGYVSSQGEFAQRFARELEGRLGVACALELAEQTEFPEPRVRVNTDPLDPAALGWDESAAWDELAAHYREAFAGGGQ
jgi:nucleoside-diphosphate-sugar epimerase